MLRRIAAAGCTAILGLVLATPLAAQDTIRYHIAFPNAVHHEARVTVLYDDLPAAPLELRMSRSSPGRYALHEFAKNAYDVTATTPAGDTLAIVRPNPHQWNVTGHDGSVRVSYTLFGDRTDGTYAGIDHTHGHLNMPATFMWARGTQTRPVRITFEPPANSNWRVATQLVPTDDPHTFSAPDLQYFMDSPTEVSDHLVLTREIGTGDARQVLRIALHHRGTEAEAAAYAAKAWRIAEQEAAVFGEYPRFDYGTYTFLADYLPWASGDGMEHRNSTILSSSSSLERNLDGLLGTVAHEFFHAWNMERIRSAALEPFDFEDANMSAELWFGEGFTSYYTPLTLRRADIIDDAQYLRRLSGTLNAVVNGRGRQFYSPAEMSQQAPFVDAAVSVDPTNRGNTFISYYTWGSAIGLGLDLTLRTRFDATLDDYMRALWARHGRPFRPYTADDLRDVLADVTGDAAFASDFFERFVNGRAVVDYDALLAHAGAVVRRARAGAAWLGQVSLEAAEDGTGVVVASQTLIGTPLHDAGIDRGAVITRLGDAAVTTPEQLLETVAAAAPGTQTTITFTARGVTLTRPITLSEDETIEVVPFEDAGREVTAEIRRFREAWLGAK
jgi:predicted metalloprotease with PDZ domain